MAFLRPQAALLGFGLLTACHATVTTARVKDPQRVHVETAATAPPASATEGSEPARDEDSGFPGPEGPHVTYLRDPDGTISIQVAELRRPPRVLVTSDGTISVTAWDHDRDGMAPNVVEPPDLRLVDRDYRYRRLPPVPDTQIVTPMPNVVEVREKRVTGCHGGARPILCGTLDVLAGGLATLGGYGLAETRPPTPASLVTDIGFLGLGIAGLVVFTTGLLTPDSPERVLYGGR